MLPDKQIKAQYKPIFWKNPEKYYPTTVLQEEGFHRNFCITCKRPFWHVDSLRKICGDPSCAPDESFAFIGKTPAKEKLDYIEVWKRFSTMFEKFGYTPINRYPTVARWNPTMEYTNASIAAFQPYVISGEINPPANPLVIPQFCMRFGDIDNVGITQSHNTGFIMIGQHMFVPPEEWDQNKVFRHIYAWITQGLGLPKHEVTFHEDAWAGGGNLGCCMEFFSRGCELGNQVYMLYEQTPSGVQDLKIKVLDMGMGMERNAWFSQGTGTIYDATFPTVIKQLRKVTGVTYDEKLMQRYVPHAGRLNIDEVEDMEKAWNEVSSLVGTPVEELKELILPMAGVYSIAEHARSLLFVLNDGALPSNVGGGYNLRMLARRALSFIEKYHWNVDLAEVCEWHAKYLKPLFPELSEHLDDVQKILDVERVKFSHGRDKARTAVVKLLEKGTITENKLVELYDSQGISPELVQEEATKLGKSIKFPDNFYGKVAELHDLPVQKNSHSDDDAEHRDDAAQQTGEGIAGQTKSTPQLDGVKATIVHYYDKWKQHSFDATLVAINGSSVVLDETYFYPTSGGQDHDLGSIHGPDGTNYTVINIFKQGSHIIHLLDRESHLHKGDRVHCEIDSKRRLQLAQHHTSTHIVNAAAKRILGNHINQAGAKKTVEYAHIDITHYEALTDEIVQKISAEANTIIHASIGIHKAFYQRSVAEKRFGMTIYQGGAVPGKQLRIVEIPGIDIEACGGTHLDNTSEAEEIIILKSSKIQDGIVRLQFVAGARAREIHIQENTILTEAATLLEIEPELLPGRAQEVFETWKAATKAAKKGQNLRADVCRLKSTEKSIGTNAELLTKTALALQTQPEHIVKTLIRFLDDLKKNCV